MMLCTRRMVVALRRCLCRARRVVRPRLCLGRFSFLLWGAPVKLSAKMLVIGC